MTSPCHHCTERTMTCHDACEKYEKFDRENKKRLAAKNNEGNILSDILAVRAKMDKIRRQKNRR